MIDENQLTLDRIAALEDRALTALGPQVAEGARLMEAERRIDQAADWLTLARAECDPADRAGLARAHAQLLKAREDVRAALS